MGEARNILFIEMNELVSIIMPVYNGEKFIKYAIESVLSQTYENWEMIVIDDASTDNSMKVVKEYRDCRIHIYSNLYNRGIAYTRNYGLTLCQGEYISLLDDDDIISNDKLQLQVEFLEANPQIDILGGKAVWIDEEGNEISETSKVYLENEEIKALALLKNPFWNCEVMFRNSIIKKYKYYYKDYMYGMEDYHFWIRYLTKCKAANLDNVLLYHRKSTETETSRVSRENRSDRERIFNFLRMLSLRLNGIHLPDEQLGVINRFYGYNGNKTVSTLEELHVLYSVLQDICTLVNANKPGVYAINRICKDLFVNTLEMSNSLWWD